MLNLGKPRIVHANALCINGYGILISGPSGSGKTRLTLQMLSRGHQVIADDAVCLTPTLSGLVATAPEITYNQLATHQRQILNITDLFGHKALIRKCLINLHVALVPNTSPLTGLDIKVVHQKPLLSSKQFEMLVINALH